MGTELAQGRVAARLQDLEWLLPEVRLNRRRWRARYATPLPLGALLEALTIHIAPIAVQYFRLRWKGPGQYRTVTDETAAHARPRAAAVSGVRALVSGVDGPDGHGRISPSRHKPHTTQAAQLEIADGDATVSSVKKWGLELIPRLWRQHELGAGKMMQC